MLVSGRGLRPLHDSTAQLHPTFHSTNRSADFPAHHRKLSLGIAVAEWVAGAKRWVVCLAYRCCFIRFGVPKGGTKGFFFSNSLEPFQPVGCWESDKM